MRDYRKIRAWQHADDLTVSIYEATRGFPRDEQWSLTSQLRRAAYSVPANVAEGASRNSQKDYLHFLYIARGSLNEARYFLHLANRLGYLPSEPYSELSTQAENTMKILTGLIQAVEAESSLLTKTAAKLTSWAIVLFGTGLASIVGSR
jgi:four helix bundle protein